MPSDLSDMKMKIPLPTLLPNTTYLPFGENAGATTGKLSTANSLGCSSVARTALAAHDSDSQATAATMRDSNSVLVGSLIASNPFYDQAAIQSTRPVLKAVRFHLERLSENGL